MALSFQSDHFVIKRKGLSTGKFRIVNEKGDLLFYVEEKIKWTAPFTTTVRFYADEEKKQEVLTVTDGRGNEYKNLLEVIDPTAGPVGAIGGDWGDFFKEAWGLLDAQGNTLAQVREPGTGRAILHTLTDGLIGQKMVVQVGDTTICEMRQKKVLVGSNLLVNFVPEASARLDHRLVLAAAVFIAAHQAKSDMD